MVWGMHSDSLKIMLLGRVRLTMLVNERSMRNTANFTEVPPIHLMCQGSVENCHLPS